MRLVQAAEEEKHTTAELAAEEGQNAEDNQVGVAAALNTAAAEAVAILRRIAAPAGKAALMAAEAAVAILAPAVVNQVGQEAPMEGKEVLEEVAEMMAMTRPS